MPATWDEAGDRPHNLQLKFRRIDDSLAVCRLSPDAPLPEWAMTSAFTSVTRTADELSIVCLAKQVPEGIKSEQPWVCFKLEGPFPFLQTGVLASFIDPLAIMLSLLIFIGEAVRDAFDPRKTFA